MYDLAVEDDREQMALRIESDIEAASVELYTEPRRKHLGCSVIGDECSRKLYYSFRWCWPDTFIGRMLRLFNQGHREEERFVAYLRQKGFEVYEVDPNTGKQFRISGAKGHFGGSLDGVAVAPSDYGVEGELLIEFKTMNTGTFSKLKIAKSVAQIFPKYFAQMCEYGFKKGYRYAIFLAANKNDNDIYCEIVKLNWAFGETLEVKAHEIIFAKEPPPRVSENPADFKCAYCFAKEGCHNGKPVEVNCRSCQHLEPVDNAQWFCHIFKQIVPDSFIETGCDKHQGIVSH